MLITTYSEAISLAYTIEKQGFIVLDAETTGLQPWQGDMIVGIGIALPNEECYYVPVRAPDENLSAAGVKIIWEAIQKVPIVVGFNFKFDLATFYQDGLELKPEQKIEDLIVAARICTKQQFGSLSLENQSIRFLGWSSVQYEAELKAWMKAHKLSKAHMKQIPAAIVAEYCDGDVLCTLRLRAKYKEILEVSGQDAVWTQENGVTRATWEMERDGVFYDKAHVEEKIPQLEEYVEHCKEDVYSIVGYEFNINSNDQLSQAMAKLGVKPIKRSDKTGKPSWSVDVLKELHNELAGKILEIRGITKLLSTYYLPAARDWDGVQHPILANWGAITGRFSCKVPNLQNVAKQTSILAYDDDDVMSLLADMYSPDELERQKYTGLIKVKKWDEDNKDLVSVRRFYVPRPGYTLYMIDYSQMEMRVFAEYTKDEQMLELCEDKAFDFHTNVANVVWNSYEGDEWFEWYRFLAKAINFGLIFGIGNEKLGRDTGKTTTEAAAYKAEYFDRFPKALDFIEQVKRQAARKGFVHNMYKRRYYIDQGFEYKAVNYLVQGTSADIVKNRLVALRDFLLPYESRLILCIHDEFVFEVAYGEEFLVPVLKDICEERQTNIFLPADVSKGDPSWASVVKISEEELELMRR